MNWINDSKFSLTFINRLQTRFTILLCEISGAISPVCSKVIKIFFAHLMNEFNLCFTCSWVIKMVLMRIPENSSFRQQCHLSTLTKTYLCIFLFRPQEIKFWWRVSEATAATISDRLSYSPIILRRSEKLNAGTSTERSCKWFKNSWAFKGKLLFPYQAGFLNV